MAIFDKLDRELLRLLEKDPRQSTKVLAKQTGVSYSTARRRINKLIKNKMLRMVVHTDPDRTHLPILCFMGISTERKKIESVKEYLVSREEVVWLAITTGRFDIIIMTRFATLEELHTFLRRDMAVMEGIQSSETFMCLSREKAAYVVE